MNGILSDTVKPVISREIIDYQNNDYIVDTITECYTTIYEVIDREKYTDIKKFGADKTIIRVTNKLNKELTKRFGIGIQHTYVADGNYSIIPILPDNKNVLNENTTAIKEMMDNIGNKAQENPTNDDVYSEILSETTGPATLGRMLESYNSINKAFNGDGIHVDLKKAKITGVDKEFVLVVLGDVMHMKSNDITPRELTAVLLHEIGHGFTHIEYSARTVKNSNAMVDAIRTNTYNKNKPAGEVINILAKNMNIEKEVKEQSTMLGKAIYLFNNLFSEEYNSMSKNDHYQSELLADQFAGRFGLGNELGTVLQKLSDNRNTILLDLGIPTVLFWIVASILIIIIAPTITGAIFLIGLVYFIHYIESYIKQSLPGGKEYPNDRDRLISIKLDLIRVLRHTTADKSLMVKLVESIDGVEELLKKLELNKFKIERAPVYKIYKKIAVEPGKLLGNKYELKKLDMLLEQMMENEIHVASAKIKLLK